MTDDTPNRSTTDNERRANTPLAHTAPTGEPIRSTLSGNTEMVELIEWFVGEMASRTEELKAAWSTRDLLRLRVVAHQLKGSSGGYGFPTLGKAAAKLEAATKAHADSQADLDAVHADLEALIDLCSRVAN